MPNKKLFTDIILENSEIKDTKGSTLTLKRVQTFSQLPLKGTADGDAYLVTDEDIIYEWDTDSNSWIPLIASVRGFIKGLQPVFYTNYAIQLLPGSIDIRGRLLMSNQSILLDTTVSTNFDVGSTKTSNTWYYVYVIENSALRRNITAFISTQPPTKNWNANSINPWDNVDKYHPTRPARFVGSFKLDTVGNIVKFQKMGDIIWYDTPQSLLVNGTSTSSVNISMEGVAPKTTQLSELYFETDGTMGLRQINKSDGTNVVQTYMGSGSFRMQLPTTNPRNIAYKVSKSNFLLNIKALGYLEMV